MAPSVVSRAYAKAKGAEAEGLVAETLRLHGFPHADRRPRNGRNDRGDIGGIENVVIEVKNEASYAGKLAGWLAETDDEIRNANASIGAVWHKRKGTTNPEQWYVTMRGAMWLKILQALRDGKTLQDI